MLIILLINGFLLILVMENIWIEDRFFNIFYAQEPVYSWK